MLILIRLIVKVLSYMYTGVRTKVQMAWASFGPRAPSGIFIVIECSREVMTPETSVVAEVDARPDNKDLKMFNKCIVSYHHLS